MKIIKDMRKFLYFHLIVLTMIFSIFGIYSNLYAQEIFNIKGHNLVSAADVKISVTVMHNLSLSLVDNQPVYATNAPWGASLTMDEVSDNIIYWTVSADY